VLRERRIRSKHEWAIAWLGRLESEGFSCDRLATSSS